MKSTRGVILLGSIAVLLFDALASSLSLQFGFAYARAAIGTYVIYAFAGFLAGRFGGWKHGALVGVALGLVDATIGWAVSWFIGPGKPVDGASLTPILWIGVALTVMLLGAILGAIGGAVGRVVHNRRAPAV